MSITLSLYLRSYLLSVLQIYHDQFVYFKGLDVFDFNSYQPQIVLTKNEDQIVYKSAFCLTLARFYQIKPRTFATDIAAIFEEVVNSDKNITVLVSGEGWLEFTISNRSLAEYLYFLSVTKFPKLDNHEIKTEIDFNFIYTHGRFCSLLRSAQQQNLLDLDNNNFVLNQWQVMNLDKTIYEYLIFLKQEDLSLIKSLIYCAEMIFSDGVKVNYFNLLKILNQALMDWEKNCRIWGETKNSYLSLAQARLGLSAIALNYYQNLSYLVFRRILPSQL